MAIPIPRLYPILDASILPALGRAQFLQRIGNSMAEAGVTLLEYRNKTGSDNDVLAEAEVLRRAMPAGHVKLVLDDRVHLVNPSGFDGVHVDAGDMSPAEARSILGAERIIGTFGGSESLVQDILLAPADYLSIGPVYPTQTKQTTKQPIGTEGVRKLRAEAGVVPILVAVGGITLDTAAMVLAAGASTIAVSAAIFRRPDPAAEFRRWVVEIGG
jgi:thiamine-phosphate pyrophosphorylase